MKSLGMRLLIVGCVTAVNLGDDADTTAWTRDRHQRQ